MHTATINADRNYFQSGRIRLIIIFKAVGFDAFREVESSYRATVFVR